MDKKLKHTIMMLIAFAIVLFAVVTRLSTVWRFIIGIAKLILPIIIGLVIAFVLNVPMRGFEKMFYRLFPKTRKWPKRIIYIICLVLTLICLCLVLTLVATLAVPEIVDSVKSIYNILKDKIPDLVKFLEKNDIDATSVSSWFSSIDINSLIDRIGSGAETVIVSVISFASDTVAGVASVIFALVISIYVLVSKDTVSRQAKKLLYTFTKKRIADRVCDVADLSNKIFSQYLSGQCIEACILGLLITISFAVFRLPYAGLIGILTGISAFIPYVGAFAACFVGAFLILLVSPMQALISIIIFCVIQFVETQFIYPHVVGGSVGLSPLLTLLAALVGGNVMGLFGIIFFIPLTAVIYTLLREYVNKKLAEKRIKIE